MDSPGKCKVFVLWLGIPLDALIHTSVGRSTGTEYQSSFNKYLLSKAQG